jgi:hypothetical protein
VGGQFLLTVIFIGAGYVKVSQAMVFRMCHPYQTVCFVLCNAMQDRCASRTHPTYFPRVCVTMQCTRPYLLYGTLLQYGAMQYAVHAVIIASSYCIGRRIKAVLHELNTL